MDKVNVVYEGPNEVKWITWGGADYIFEQGVPQEVPADFAKNLIENNPAAWQPKYCDRYRVVVPVKDPVEVEEEEGGDV